jgi:hypothetical protein
MHTSYKTTIQDRWACKTYKDYGKARCDNIMINYDDLNNILRETIYDFIKNKEFIIKNLLIIFEKSLRETKKTHNVDDALKRIKELEQQKDTIRDYLYKKVITVDEYNKDVAKVDSKIEILEKSITEADRENEGKKTKIERLNEISKELKSLKIKNNSVITDDNLKNFISKITVFPDGKLDIILMSEIPITAQYIKQNARRRTKAEIEAARLAGRK